VSQSPEFTEVEQPFIDWSNPQNNVFRAVSQFQVACPVG
jgi:hypothetical protein